MIRKPCRWNNYGRLIGWSVYKNEELVCDLCYHSTQDEFWDRYAIANCSSDRQVRSDEFWDQRGLRTVLRGCDDVAKFDVLYRWDDETGLLLARALWASMPLSFGEKLRFIRYAILSGNEGGVNRR